MTGTDVETRARDLLQDLDATGSPRWTDAIVLRWMNDGVRRVIQLRPDVRVKSDNTLLDYADATALASTLILEDDFLMALADYVCYRCFEMDSDDTANAQLAQSHEQKFMGEIYG